MYLEIEALEKLAVAMGVTPLSAFGFADEWYDQTMQWHSEEDGLRAVAALRSGLDTHADSDLTRDLAALDAALRIASAQGVAFCLLLRRCGKDSLQMVESGEKRSGMFW